jgi:predicted transcriptional regulator
MVSSMATDSDAIERRAAELVEKTVLYEQQANVQARVEAGMSREEIAEDLGLSEHTVRRHRQNTEEKLQLVAGTVALLDVPEYDPDQ